MLNALRVVLPVLIFLLPGGCILLAGFAAYTLYRSKKARKAKRTNGPKSRMDG
jgi:hypothetical protein